MTNEWQAKITSGFEMAVKKTEKIQSSKLNKARLKFISQIINALCVGRNVSFMELADKMNSTCSTASSLRQIQRFMADYEVDYKWWACLILLLLPPKSKYSLSIDRTEWEFGKQNHNVLVITLYTHGIGIPIWVECLANNGGNSCTDDRLYVLLCVLKCLGKKRIKAVLGDSEFIGKEWIAFLCKEKITFYLDIRSNQYFTFKGRRYQIKEYIQGKKKASLDNITIYGQELGIVIKYQPQKKKSILAIITNTKAKKALGNYQNRWSIEVAFQAWKGRGFNLENTHLKDPNRLRKLLLLCTLALVLCVAIGVALHQKGKPIPVKNHGYKTNSFFRYGLDFIREASKTNKKITIQQNTQKHIELVIKQILKNINLNYDAKAA